MCSRLLITILFVSVPGAANPQLFANIKVNQSVTIALPAAECDAKVVRRDVGQLTLVLKRSTACGRSKSIVTLERADVNDVIDERPPGRRPDPRLSAAGVCTVLAWVVVAVPAVQLVGETAKSNAPALAVFFGSGAASAVVCHAIFRSGPRYSVFASKFTPLPAAKVP